MKGTEVTPEQKTAAQEFLKSVSEVDWPDDETPRTVRCCDLIRLIAWYGALRAGKQRQRPGPIRELP
jgi:hypothetical protein